MRHSWQKIRRILAPRLDIPFARDDANRFLPWIIVLMVCLAGIFIAGGITVGEILNLKKNDLSQWVTLQIPAPDGIGSTAAEAASKMGDAVQAVLSRQQELDRIDRLSPQEAAKLLEPWFGKDVAMAQLPLPIIFQAHLKDGATLNEITLKTALATVAPQVDIDTHAFWVDHYLQLISSLRWGAYLLALLVIIATTIMIVFTSKTALKLHEDAVWLLHSLGASHDYIARQFQFNALLLGMRGALFGTLLSSALFFALAALTASFDAPLLPALPISGWHVVVWLTLPILTGLLAMLVARRTVLGMLLKIA